VSSWLGEHALDHSIDGDRLHYTLPWQSGAGERADFAARLQALLAEQGAPFHELAEEETSLESVYLDAMAAPDGPPHPALHADLPTRWGGEGIRAARMFGSLRSQGGLLRHALPFYVSSWWRRGDLSWVMYLNAFVLLLVVGTSLFGQLPGVAGQVAQRFAGGQALQAGLLLPLFFLSFALLESIKRSIGIWWEKAQGSLEVLLYTPVDDPSLIWLEVLPGAIVSTAWVTVWTTAGLALLSLFGEAAPWDLLPVFAFVAAAPEHRRGRRGARAGGGARRDRGHHQREWPLAFLVGCARRGERWADRSDAGSHDEPRCAGSGEWRDRGRRRAVRDRGDARTD